jgi:hypothetical protein
MSPDICPNCGAEIPEKARACPDCGADEKTGWSDKAKYDSLGIPDESFDYEEFVKQEFGETKPKPKSSILWLIIAVLLALAFTAAFWRR